MTSKYNTKAFPRQYYLDVPENRGFLMFVENGKYSGERATFTERIEKAVQWGELSQDEKDIWIAKV